MCHDYLVNRKPTWLEKVSAPILLRIHSWPRFVFPLLLASVLLGGLFISQPLISTALLSLVAITLVWLITLSWPLLTGGQRLIRTLLVIALFFYAFGRFNGSL
jgi:hypothetical protein